MNTDKAPNGMEATLMEPAPTFDVYVDLTFWALPLHISIQSYGVAVAFLCFHFNWNKG